jgi:hypothetical protein
VNSGGELSHLRGLHDFAVLPNDERQAEPVVFGIYLLRGAAQGTERGLPEAKPGWVAKVNI